MVEEMLLLQVEKIIPETASAISIHLSSYSDTFKSLNYQAGQFITLVLNIRGKERRRSYSISSSPLDPFFAITFKKIINGEISNYLFQNMHVGSILQAIPPTGRFVLETASLHQPRDVFFIAAGSGITPVFSMLKYLLQHDPRANTHLFYSNSNEEQTIFFRQLNDLSLQYPTRLQITYIFSEPSTRHAAIRGHLNIGLLQSEIMRHLRHPLKASEFYLCGPFSFMRMADMAIVVLGVEEEKIHRENFTIRLNPLPENFHDTLPLHDKRIQFLYKGRWINALAKYNQTLLQAAQEHGIPLPYSCKAGICGTCVVKCLKGKVAMSVNEVLTEKDLRHGLVLSCVGYALEEHLKIEIIG